MSSAARPHYLQREVEVARMFCNARSNRRGVPVLSAPELTIITSRSVRRQDTASRNCRAYATESGNYARWIMFVTVARDCWQSECRHTGVARCRKNRCVVTIEEGVSMTNSSNTGFTRIIKATGYSWKGICAAYRKRSRVSPGSVAVCSYDSAGPVSR